jgi:hypothetical protein
MEIYIYKNGQKLGPFNEQVVRAGIATGQFLHTDFGWYPGLPDWQPLSQILNTLPPSPYPLHQSMHSSGLASTSFVLSLASFCTWLFLIVLYIQTHRFRNIDEFMVLIIFILIVCVAANISGIVFGIIGITKNISNKWMAIVGMIVNTIGLFALAVLFTD